MDFTLTPEQEELKAEARRWLADRFPLDRDFERDDDRWDELAELGWLDVAEAGLGFVEEALLLEEMAYALYPGPYLAHVATGSSGSERSPLEVNGFVYGGDEDDGEEVVSIDPARPLRRAANGDGQAETPRFRAACAAEAVGVAQRALDLGVEHAKTRVQFGKPVGAYQAVAHPLAQTYTDVELARSLAYWAAWCVAEQDEHAPVAAAAAKAVATEAAVAACERSIQAHGGIGFTWEHPLHRFYKRALWLEGFGLRPAALHLEVADTLLGSTLLAGAD
jgi:alkylation response protein AidB-like acyl-CoA dehydrogenase